MGKTELMAFVFIGRDVNLKRQGLYFQDAPSYFGVLPFEAEGFTPDPEDGEMPDGCLLEGDGVRYEWQRERKPSDVFSLDGALDSLRGVRCDGRMGRDSARLP